MIIKQINLLRGLRAWIVIVPMIIGGGCNGGNGTSGPSTATSWAKTYGGTFTDFARSIQQTTDGGYIVLGGTASYGAGGFDACLLKLKADGTVEWQKSYGGTGQDNAASLRQTSDGGYIMAGDTYSFGAGDHDVWIVKLNADGTILWQKTYGGTTYDIANSIQPTRDGGYIVAGATDTWRPAFDHVWIMKLNADGTVSWQKTYGGVDLDHATSVQQTSDGGYIVAGYTFSFGAGGADIWVMKLDGNGSVAWQKTYGGMYDDFGRDIQQTTDGGYIVAGSTESFGAGNTDAWIIKLNTDGTINWQKTYGGSSNEIALSIRQTNDGGYIFAGRGSSFGAGGDDMWVVKLNADGTPSWEKAYGGSSADAAGLIQPTNDSGYIVAGNSASFGAGGYDVWILKLKGDGTINFNASSGASLTNTTATVSAAVVTDSNTGAIISDTTVIPTDSSAIITNINVLVQQQAP